MIKSINTNQSVLLLIYKMRYLVICSLLPIFLAKADSSERQLDAHTHGNGNLNIAFEAQTILLELHTPAYNIVGFEHKPKNDKDKATIKNALSVLNNPKELFSFPANARCQIIDVKIDSTIIGDQNTHHKEKDHGHGHKAKDHGHSHKKSEHDDHSKNDIHSEFHAIYEFKCGAIKNVKTIEVLLFKNFPNTRKLTVQIILPHIQSAFELTPSSAILEF